MNYPTELAPELHYLTGSDALGPVGHDAVEELAEHGMVAALGLTERQGSVLADVGQQRHIAEYCPNDATRFGGPEAVGRWQKKARGFVGIYAVEGYQGRYVPSRLRDKLDEDQLGMVGYGWSGPEGDTGVEGADITTAYRVTQLGRELARRVTMQERERGCLGPEERWTLGLPLGRLVVASSVYAHEVDPPERISLETWQSNTAATGLYDQLGFVTRRIVRSERPTLMSTEELCRKGIALIGEHEENGAVKRFVRDSRVYMQLDPEKFEIAGDG